MLEIQMQLVNTSILVEYVKTIRTMIMRTSKISESMRGHKTKQEELFQYIISERWLNKTRSIIAHGYETRSFVHTCLRRRSGQALLQETGISLGYRRRQRGLPGNTIHSSRFESVDHLRQGDHFRPSRLDRPQVLAVYDIDAARDSLIAHAQ